jgi:hypothetical protein
MKLAAGRRAWQRWHTAAGPWQGWSICPLLASPELEALPDCPPPNATAADRLAQAMLPLLEPGGALCLLDLAPELGVQTAARLADRAYPVLVLPRWPYAEAVLPVDALAAALVFEARRLPRQRAPLPNVLIVVDGERMRPLPGRPGTDRRADNRHVLGASELPNLATLRARGIQRVHRITRR